MSLPVTEEERAANRLLTDPDPRCGKTWFERMEAKVDAINEKVDRLLKPTVISSLAGGSQADYRSGCQPFTALEIMHGSAFNPMKKRGDL